MTIRFIAAALVAILTLAFAAPGFAQAPIAAPVGPAVQTQALGAAPGVTSVPAIDVATSFSVIPMFLRADMMLLSNLKRKARRFDKLFWSGQSLDELYQQFASHNDHPLAAMFIAGLREWRRAFESGTPRESSLPGIKERIDKAMSVTILRETDGMEKQLGLLATIGSVSPFVGLFGTVWGIMNSFAAIAARHDTTLAVVAPGIAEALFATAMGLLAAIPAVIFYNRFVADTGRYVNQLDAFADEFSAILSRQLDEKAMP